MRCASRLAGVLAGILSVGAFPRGAARMAEAKPPSDADAKRLVEAVFAAAPAERSKALEALRVVDELTPAEAEAWRKPLLALAGRGPRAPTKGKNFLYEKPERGLYFLSGAAGRSGLLVALHGGGLGEGDAGSAASAFGGPASAARLWMAAPEVLVKTEHGWTDPPDTERFVMDLVEQLKRAGRLDPNRIYLAGHSMGGYGTWTLGAIYADTFAGLAAFAGAPTCTRTAAGAPISGVEEGILPNLRNLPIFVYQSLDDHNVPAESKEFATKELDRLATEDPGGYEHVYERVDGRGHAFPEKGPEPGVLWATRHVRNPRPQKIVWQPVRAWKKSFYWLSWERPPLGSTVTVETKQKNAFDVASTGPVDGLAILLDDRLADLSKEVVVTVNGKETYRGIPRLSLTTMVRTAAERDDADLLFVAEVPVLPSGR